MNLPLQYIYFFIIFITITLIIYNYTTITPKIIFIFWDTSFKNAPIIVKKCLSSWKKRNPTWTIIELDNKSLSNYIDIKKDIPDIENKSITKQAYSDIIRIFLLEKYGGCWCDATTFCNKPLDNWLGAYSKTGFFAFSKPANNRLVSSWFLYCNKNSYIIKRWKEETINYWNLNNKTNNYYWFHTLFNNLYYSDTRFKILWYFSPKISADGPHFIISRLNLPFSKETKNHIDNGKTPVYKITYKLNKKNFRNNNNLIYLFNKLEN